MGGTLLHCLIDHSKGRFSDQIKQICICSGALFLRCCVSPQIQPLTPQARLRKVQQDSPADLELVAVSVTRGEHPAELSPSTWVRYHSPPLSTYSMHPITQSCPPWPLLDKYYNCPIICDMCPCSGIRFMCRMQDTYYSLHYSGVSGHTSGVISGVTGVKSLV